jgi:hypothetical protein
LAPAEDAELVAAFREIGDIPGLKFPRRIAYGEGARPRQYIPATCSRDARELGARRVTARANAESFGRLVNRSNRLQAQRPHQRDVPPPNFAHQCAPAAEQVLANITAQTIRRLAQTIHDIQIIVPKSQVVFHQPIAVIQFNPD